VSHIAPCEDTNDGQYTIKGVHNKVATSYLAYLSDIVVLLELSQFAFQKTHLR
jgi:hypothetical protein